jgi:SAM-dependent methyltransferase
MDNGNTAAIMDRLLWIEPNELQIGETRFYLCFDSEISDAIDSTPDKFVMMKDDSMIKRCLASFPASVENMVELGIYKGGSIAMYEELFTPNRLVGIDLLPERVAALDEYLDRRDATDRVRLHYGTAQDDRQAIKGILREDFADNRCLDVVIDDASHQYQPTKEALKILLPLLRPGGIYLIEDWGWAHCRPEDRHWRNPEYNLDDIPLSRLVFEAVMVSCSNPEVISDVLIDWGRAILVRGWKDVPEPDFEISRYFTTDLWRFELRHRRWKRNLVRRSASKVKSRL